MNRTVPALLILIGLAAIGAVGCGADSPFNPKTGGAGATPSAAQSTGGLGNEAGTVTTGGETGGITGGITTGGGITTAGGITTGGGIITAGGGTSAGSGLTGGSTSGTTPPPPSAPPPANPPPTIQPLLGFQSLTANATGVEGGESAVGIVTLVRDAPVGGAIIKLITDNGAVSIPTTITVPAGTTQATFSINTRPVTRVMLGSITAIDLVGMTDSSSITFAVAPSADAVSKLSTTDCTPGQPITVSITITPPPGSHDYAGSDLVPRGSTVVNLGPASGITQGIATGVNFDAKHNSVNFFFLDATTRTITYTFTPPAASANSIIILYGNVAFDGVTEPILGERIIQCSS